MPGVDVYYTSSINNSFGTEERESVKTSVRRFGTTRFSVEELVLNDHDFSFKFHVPEEGDELTNSIIVRIRLHGFEERRDRFSDALAENLAIYIAEDLASYFVVAEVTIGVELMLVGVGLFWGTASTLD